MKKKKSKVENAIFLKIIRIVFKLLEEVEKYENRNE
jgi:hypothetical protein